MQPSVAPKRSNTQLAVFCHVLAFAGYIVPFGHIIGPLVLWLVKRQDDPAVDEHGKEAVNWQIAVTIYSIAMVIVMFILAAVIGGAGIALGFLGIFAAVVLDIVSIIRGALAASRGESFRYPLSIRFIR
ncbi:MAG: DUF4870 domain-containing protein [Kofleriaceae bacterium]